MRHLIILATVLLVGTILFEALAREPILLAIGDHLVVQDELYSADVIHVISGLDHRTDYAIQLYKQGYGKKIFFTGGWCPLIQGNHAARGFTRAVEQGVSTQAIAIDGSRVTSTYTEVVKLKEFIDQSQVPIHSVIVVSAPHHMRRARWAYRHVLGEHVSLQMAPLPFELSPYQHRWWTDKGSRRMVWNEYLKFVYYYARYRLSWGPVRDWLASFDRD